MQKALEYVDKNLESFIEDLKTLCSIPSISAQNKGMEEAAEKVKELLENSGINAKILRIEDVNPLVYGEYKPTSYNKTIIFYNHTMCSLLIL